MNNQAQLGSGDSFLLENVLKYPGLFERVRDEVLWGELNQKGSSVPRAVAIQGTLTVETDVYEPLYRHPADEQPELVSWTPTVLWIKEKIEMLSGKTFNHALIQYYRSERDYIGEHSDKTLDILLKSNIISYSLGATRTFVLRKKLTGERVRVRMPHDSLFVLGWETNRNWRHSINQDKRMLKEKSNDEKAFMEQRISVTLRHIATFRNRRTGLLHGQGARRKEPWNGNDFKEEMSEDSLAMLHAFSAENRLASNFDWDKHYGGGFDAVNFKILNNNLPPSLSQPTEKRCALLIIDLQRDFVTPNSPFGTTCVAIHSIITKLAEVLPKFRAKQGVVLWVLSNYSESGRKPIPFVRPTGEKFAKVPMNDEFLSGTHTNFPLCVFGTQGAELAPEAKELMKECDHVLLKRYYSAFTETSLIDLLKDVDKVHFCGLVTNVCVQATAADAFFHGKQVVVWRDCVGYRNEKKHTQALDYIQRWYGSTINADEFDEEKLPVLYYVNGSIPNWRVQLALYEKKIKFKGCRLKVMSGETQSTEFLAINPRGETPTLIDSDGSMISESLAILQYLEEYYSNHALLPLEKEKHIITLRLVQESQRLVSFYAPLEDSHSKE